jgi:transketolase
VASKNGYDVKIAVLTEQMKRIGEDLTEHRSDTRTAWTNLSSEIRDLKTEVVKRAEEHGASDSEQFRAINKRLTDSELATATRESARDAVSRYKKTQWSLIGGAIATILWNAFRMLEPVIHRMITP